MEKENNFPCLANTILLIYTLNTNTITWQRSVLCQRMSCPTWQIIGLSYGLSLRYFQGTDNLFTSHLCVLMFVCVCMCVCEQNKANNFYTKCIFLLKINLVEKTFSDETIKSKTLADPFSFSVSVTKFHLFFQKR